MGDDAVADCFGARTRLRLERGLLLLGLLAFAAFVVLGIRFVLQTRADELETRNKLAAIAHDASDRIDRILAPVRAATTELAGRLSRGEIAPADVEPALRAMVNGNECFFGGAVAYRPYGHDKGRRLYAPYFQRDPGGNAVGPTQLADDYDYTVPENRPDSKTDWFVRPMSRGGGDGWSPPYFDPSLKISMITYSAVFTTTGPQPEKNGVVTIDVSMDRLKQIIRELELGPGGFGALTTSGGAYLYHPDERLVRHGKTLLDVARERHDADRVALAQAASARASGVIQHRSTTTGTSAWVAFSPVPSTGWSLQITFVRNDVPARVDEMRAQLIWITIAAIGWLGCMLLLLLRAHEGRTPRLWAGSAAISALLLAGIGAVWYQALNHPAAVTDGEPGAEIAISAREVLAAQKDLFDEQRLERKQVPLAYIPTGLHIESIELDGANKLAVTGQIWQKFPADAPSTDRRGVTFLGAQNLTMALVDTRADDASRFVVQRSRFQFNLAPQFDFSRYPLEVERIRIGIRPVDQQGAQALVPDLDSYNIMLASHLPGMAPGVQIAGWTIDSATFVLRSRSENSQFGIDSRVDLEIFPDLYYDIVVKRIFVDAFISNLTPLIVVAIVLFWLLLLPESVEIREILGFSVSLFFVVVYAHLSIRRVISSGQIFYLEYFFLVTYFALLAVPVNAFRKALHLRNAVLEYRAGLTMKLLYWPLMLGIFFLITVLKFY